MEFSFRLLPQLVPFPIVHLFPISKKAGEGRRTMTTVLDPKRSNAINIGLTTLPPVHVIKAALLNFDEFAVSKDGIEVGIPRWECGKEVGGPAFFVQWTFPAPPVVGMGLAFL